MNDMVSNVNALPRVNPQEIPIWNVNKAQCGGYLHKKAGKKDDPFDHDFIFIHS